MAMSSSYGRIGNGCGARGWLLDPRKILALEEIRRLRGLLLRARDEAVVRGLKTPVRDWFIVEGALSTGLRVCELARLSCGDVVLEDAFPSVVVRRGKGGKARLVHIALEFREAISWFLAWKRAVGEPVGESSPLLHSARSGSGMSTRGVQKAFERSLVRAGIEGHSIHHARHSYATYLLKVSKNLRLVQKQLGHSRVTTTQVYADVLGEEFTEHLEALGELFGLGL